MADLRDDDRLFAVVGSRSAIGTTELNVMLIRNPNSSTRTMKLRTLVYENSATVSSQLRVRLYASPTVTADGTAASEVCLDIGSGKTSDAECFTSPTTSAPGTLFLDVMTLGGAASKDGVVNFPDGLQIRPNNSILITAISDGTNRTANITLVWEES